MEIEPKVEEIDEKKEQGKSEEPVKNQMLSNILGILCAICLGVGNYLNAVISAKYGVKSIFVMFPGLTLLWTIYHVFTMCRLRQGLKEYLSNSEYRNKETKEIEGWRIRTTVIRFII